MTSAPADEDEFSELVDATFPRVDLVGKAANGHRFLIAKQDAGSAGLVDPEFIRDLIAKAEPGTGRERVEMPSGVTLTGSPADIAAFIHKAAERAQEREPTGTGQPLAVTKAAYEAVVKARYSAEERDTMAGNGQAMKDGSYPIKDEDDLDHAIRAVGRGGADHDAIRRHVIARAKAMGKSSKIPDNWASDGSLKEGTVSKTASDPVTKDILTPDPDGGVDSLDPTVPLAAPDDLDDVPGDPTDPGSPAWEAIDAATAQKWLSILARAQNAIGLLSDREALEAATVDPDDADNAFGLQDAACCLDYVIGQLAVFAAGEQAEADLAAEAMEQVGKAAAGAEVPVGVIETLAAVRKAGRVLSAANEAKIRQAAQSLGEVLASLPQAPDSGQSAAVTKEGAMPATPTKPAAVAKDAVPSADQQAADTGPVNLGGTTGVGQPRVTGPAGSLPGDGPQEALPGDPAGRTVIKAALKAVVYDRGGRECKVDPAQIRTSIAKADGDGDSAPALQAVFDENGDLIGVVDPAQIQPVAGAGGRKDDTPDGDGTGPTPDATDGSGDGDLTPQPSGDAGTPAADVQPDGTVTKTAAPQDFATEVAKSVTEAVQGTIAAHSAGLEETIAKQAKVIGDQAEELRVLKERVTVVENNPAAPGVFANGATPPAGARPPVRPELRGQDQGAVPVDVAKAAELRQTLYKGSGPEQADAFHQLEGMAIAEFTRLRGGSPQSPARAS